MKMQLCFPMCVLFSWSDTRTFQPRLHPPTPDLKGVYLASFVATKLVCVVRMRYASSLWWSFSCLGIAFKKLRLSSVVECSFCQSVLGR